MTDQEGGGGLRLRGEPRGPLNLGGDFYTRIVRSIQALLGQDPQQITIPQPFFDGRVTYQATVLDASGAPYRKNGRAFAVPFRAGAGGAGVTNLLEFQNQSQKGRVALLDYLVDGDGVSGVRVSSEMIPGAGAAIAGVVDLESPPIGSQAGSKSRPIISDMSAALSAATPAFAGGQEVIDLPASGGSPHPLFLTVWPGELVDINQLVANVAWTGTLFGRIVDFGDKLPSV